MHEEELRTGGVIQGVTHEQELLSYKRNFLFKQLNNQYYTYIHALYIYTVQGIAPPAPPAPPTAVGGGGAKNYKPRRRRRARQADWRAGGASNICLKIGEIRFLVM